MAKRTTGARVIERPANAAEAWLAQMAACGVRASGRRGRYNTPLY